MEYSNEFMNQLMEESVQFSEELATKHHYPENITHLLYLMIPAFILKYGTNRKEELKAYFQKIPIQIQDEKDKVYQAYYYSVPKKVNGEIITVKGIVLKNYENIDLMQLLDNLVHELNHAINSLQKEIIVKNQIQIRTGIVYNYFDKNSLTFIKKGEEVIMEEVINTKQTELIIQKIKSFYHYEIKNPTISSTLYAIHHAFDQEYHSQSYYLESYVCQELLQNKTFLSTLEILRFEGEIEDIHHFFDDIVGKEGAFLKLSQYLNQSLQLQKKLATTKFFKKAKIEKIREVNAKALEIVQKFNQNTIYK